MVEEKNMLKAIGLAVAIVILGVISALVLGSILDSSVFDCTNTTSSNSSDLLIESSTTLSPIGDGITSSSVKANNQTWLEFDGVDDYVELTKSFSDFNFSNPTTLSVWFLANNITNNQEIISFTGSDTNNMTGINLNANRVKVYFRNGVSQDITEPTDETSLNTWYNIQVVYNNNNIKYFRDGEYINDGDVVGEVGTYQMKLGRLASTNANKLNGSIDDVAYINDNFGIGAVNYLYRQSRDNSFPPIPILMYHKICPQTNDLCVNETTFTEQMDYLNESGFSTITDSDYYNYVQNSFAMPDKPVMMVFDDAYISVIENASRIMDDYGFKGVAAVPVEKIGDPGFMSWQNLSDLIELSNWSIASHSYNHVNLITNSSYNSPQNWTDQFNLSKIAIIGNLSYTPTMFVYPFNSFNSTITPYCASFYSLCTGSAFKGDQVLFVDKSSNLTDGALNRVNIDNITTISDYDYILNYSENSNYLFRYRINENNGTTAYDSSGNSNDGTISGATWDTDGLLVTLSQLVDYTINAATGLFTIVNTDYSWAELQTSWVYVTGESCPSGVDTDEISTLFGEFIDGLLGFLGIIGIVLGVIWLVVYVSKLFKKGGLNDLGATA